jgi:WD40 repeat protein
MAVDIPETSTGEAAIIAPFHGNEESLLEATNSAFTKVTELISYTWLKQSNVNLVAVHRSKPLVAYVINVSYHRSFVTGKTASYNPAIPEQMIRLINYDNQSRALCKMCAVDIVVDIAFSYDEIQEDNKRKNIICTIDRAGYINLFCFTELVVNVNGERKFQMSLTRFMTIQPPVGLECEDPSFIKLAWCPYVPAADGDEPNVNPATRLAVTLGQNLEIITLNGFHINPQTTVEVPRSHFKQDLGEYYCLPKVHDKEIVAVAVSNDGSLVCTTGVDNILKFFNEKFEDNIFSFTKIREWTPPLEAGESIANTAFLDDYYFLLDHPDQPFWGYMFLGTTAGVMYIYDMQQKDWKVTQKIQVSLHNSEAPETAFSYHFDQSAKVILSTTGSTVFVFLLEYNQERKEDGSIIRTPRISQVARFQLYNPVISFAVKVANENEVDIFWITLKSLERCTIEKSKMNECKVTHSTFDQPTTAATASTNKSKKINTVTPSPSAAVKPSSPSQPLPVPPAILAAQEKASQLTNELNNLKRKSDGSCVKSPLTSTTQNVMSPEARIPTSSSSVAVAQSLIQQMMSPPSSKAKPTMAANIPPTPDSQNFSLCTRMTSLPSAPLNDMAKVMLLENKIQQMTADLKASMSHTQQLISASFKGIQSEICDLKATVNQLPAQSKESPDDRNKLIQTTVNTVVNKAMQQLNITVSRGLKDFFDQVDVGIGELQTSVKTSVEEIRAGMQENNQRLEQVSTRLEIFQKQLEKNEAEQQILMYRLQQMVDAIQ